MGSSRLPAWTRRLLLLMILFPALFYAKRARAQGAPSSPAPPGAPVGAAGMGRRGEAADRVLAAGRHDVAIAACRRLIAGMMQSRHLDAFVLAKCVLGLMLAHVRKGEPEAAFELWRSDAEVTASKR